MHQTLREEIPYFSDDGMACSESTLRCLIERGVVDLPLSCVKIMTGLHGNMGRCANCGAVNAAAVAIGSIYGRCEVGDDSQTVYRLLEDFMCRFEEKFGSVKCTDLLCGKDPASMQAQLKCADQVVWAVDTITEILNREAESRK